MYKRRLASIQKIASVERIEGADKISLARVMGWNVVVGKGEFVAGMKCVFFEVDSILPMAPWSEFLVKRNPSRRLKTMRLRGVLSQGLALPTTIVDGLDQLPVGTDVSDILGVVKYEPEIPEDDAICGKFVPGVPKTNEPRIQSYVGALDELRGQAFYATVKLDGTSVTYAKLAGEFYVCSRNWRIREGNNKYWRLARRYGLIEGLPDGRALQGEICGPGIQKNRLGLREEDVFFFNYFVFGIDYFGYRSLCRICKRLGLKSVPLEMEVTGSQAKLFMHSLEGWLYGAKGTYESGHDREGLVVRPIVEQYSATIGGRLSFKVLNNDFLLKHG